MQVNNTPAEFTDASCGLRIAQLIQTSSVRHTWLTANCAVARFTQADYRNMPSRMNGLTGGLWEVYIALHPILAQWDGQSEECTLNPGDLLAVPPDTLRVLKSLPCEETGLTTYGDVLIFVTPSFDINAFVSCPDEDVSAHSSSGVVHIACNTAPPPARRIEIPAGDHQIVLNFFTLEDGCAWELDEEELMVFVDGTGQIEANEQTFAVEPLCSMRTASRQVLVARADLIGISFSVVGV